MSRGFGAAKPSSQGDEIFQQLEADVLAFFGVELGGVDVVVPDGGGEVITVLGAGGDDARVHRLGVEAVDEIDVAALGDIAIEGTIGQGDVEAVPADLGNFEAGAFGEADDAALEDAEAGGAGIEFLAVFKEGLVADANAEEGFAGADEIARGLEQFLFAEGVDAIVEGADAREDESGGIADFIGMLDEADGGTDLEERLVDAAQVSGAVIEQGNHERILSFGGRRAKGEMTNG